MGAFREGYEEARREHEAQAAEEERRNATLDAKLDEVLQLINEDDDVIKELKLIVEKSARMVRVKKTGTEILHVSYSTDDDMYTIQNHRAEEKQAADPQACAREVGRFIYAYARSFDEVAAA